MPDHPLDHPTARALCEAVVAGDDQIAALVLADVLDDAGCRNEAALVRRGILHGVFAAVERRLPVPRLYEVRTFRSRGSRLVEGRLTVEATSRRQAVELLRRMAAVVAPEFSAAHAHARLVLSGRTRTAIGPVRSRQWAAQDGTWKMVDSGRLISYGRWDR